MASETAEVVNRCDAAKASSVLDLSHCKLTAVPQAVFFLLKSTALEEVDLSWNELKKLSPKVGSSDAFRSVTRLDVSHNVLEALPDSLSGLQGLTHLDCSHNHLTSFPQVVTSLVKLEVLDLSSNQITALSVDELRRLPSLKEVCLRENPIEPSCYKVLATVVDLQITL